MNTKLFFAGLILFYCQNSLAGEEISGAFGIKLGETLDGIKVDRTLTSRVVHIVNPPTPLESLRLYTVETTKQSKRIFRITGQSLTNSKTECLRDLAAMLSTLEAKYGKFENLGAIFRITKGTKAITASCTSEGAQRSKRSYMIKVTYEDLGISANVEAL